MRGEWAGLPADVRDAIMVRTGAVRFVQAPGSGSNADLAVTLSGPSGRVFVKAAPRVSQGVDGPQVRALRREAAVSPCVPELAPRLLWTVESGGWLALGFEYVEGRLADYSPGSTDLVALAEAIHRLQDVPCPDAVVLRVERRWESLTDDLSPMAGDTFLHTDLNPHNLLIGADRRVHVVDWGFASRGASWIEIGQVIPWLMNAGHSPAEAESWAAQFPSWLQADSENIDLYAHLSAERWKQISAARPGSRFSTNLLLAREWSSHRERRR